MAIARKRNGRAKLLGSTAAACRLLCAAPAFAQASAATDDQAPPTVMAEAGAGDIIVTGSRISRAGFDQPTPTMVIGETELRQGARPTLQQVLNEQPQFSQTAAPARTITRLHTSHKYASSIPAS